MSERPDFIKNILKKTDFEGPLKEVPHETSLDKATRRENMGIIWGKPVEPKSNEKEEKTSSDE